MGEQSERRGMNHRNSAVPLPRSRVRMTDGHGDNSRPLPPAFWRKGGNWKMLELSFTCAEKWGGNGSLTVVEESTRPRPQPRLCNRVPVRRWQPRSGSSYWAHVLAWLTASLPHITTIHFAKFTAFEFSWPAGRPLMSRIPTLLLTLLSLGMGSGRVSLAPLKQPDPNHPLAKIFQPHHW